MNQSSEQAPAASSPPDNSPSETSQPSPERTRNGTGGWQAVIDELSTSSANKASASDAPATRVPEFGAAPPKRHRHVSRNRKSRVAHRPRWREASYEERSARFKKAYFRIYWWITIPGWLATLSLALAGVNHTSGSAAQGDLSVTPYGLIGAVIMIFWMVAVPMVYYIQRTIHGAFRSLQIASRPLPGPVELRNHLRSQLGREPTESEMLIAYDNLKQERNAHLVNAAAGAALVVGLHHAARRASGK